MVQLGEMQRELEIAQQEVARSWQAEHADILRHCEDLDRRESQLTRFRQRLDEREESLAGEATTLQRLLADRSYEIASEQSRLDRERAELEQQRLTESSAIQQQSAAGTGS